MKKLLKIILISLKVINYWLLVIPAKFSFFAFVGYCLFVYFYFDTVHISEIREVLGGSESLGYNLFMIFIGLPFMISFFSMFSQGMAAPGVSTNSALDRAIAYRNGLMNVSTPNRAYDIYKQTAHLDVIKANSDNELGRKVARGFTAEMRNASPQEIYKKFVD